MIRGLRPACVTLSIFVASLSAASTEPGIADRLRARGIKDAKVLEALAKVRRDAFVPADERDRGLLDVPLPIGHGRTIPQPYVVARVTELLSLRPADRVLEIGTGSGYQAAVLAELAQTVCSVESAPSLAADARLRLTHLGYRNVHVKQGDGARGWREYGPYDRVVVTVPAPRVPRALIDQLVEGGVLVMRMGAPGERQVLIRGVKRAGVLRAREIAEARLVSTTGAGTRENARNEGEHAEPPRLGGDGDAEIEPARAWPKDGIKEESLPPEETPEPKGERRGIDRRSHPDGRDRAAGVRDVPDGDRRCAAFRAGLDAARSPTAARRCAG